MLNSFSTDWFDLLAVQGTPKSLLQHHSSLAGITGADSSIIGKKTETNTILCISCRCCSVAQSRWAGQSRNRRARVRWILTKIQRQVCGGRTAFTINCTESRMPVQKMKHLSSHNKRAHRDFPGGPVVKNMPCHAGDLGLIPGRGSKIPVKHRYF